MIFFIFSLCAEQAEELIVPTSPSHCCHCLLGSLTLMSSSGLWGWRTETSPLGSPLKKLGHWMSERTCSFPSVLGRLFLIVYAYPRVKVFSEFPKSLCFLQWIDLTSSLGIWDFQRFLNSHKGSLPMSCLSVCVCQGKDGLRLPILPSCCYYSYHAFLSIVFS